MSSLRSTTLDGDNAVTQTVLPSVEQNSTTTYLDDSNVVKSDMKSYVPVNSSLHESSTDYVHQDIKAFLGKPMPISMGVNELSATDTVSTFTDVLCPTTMITSNTLWSRKLEGLVGFRADMVFKIVLNSTRFCMGRYLLSFVFTGGAPNNAKTVASKTFHTNSLQARTQCYHVEIDLSCDTSAELRVPFISAMNYFPLTNIGAYGNVGYLTLSPYVPYSFATGNTTIPFTVYGHFENIELIGAANPQMGLSDNETDKPMVSSILLSGSKFLSEIGKIPAVSQIARPAAWVSEYLGNSAKALGWSKPSLQTQSNRVVRDIMPGLCNADVVDTSKKQSLFQSNQISYMPGLSGTDMDELSIASVASRYAYVAKPTYTSANVPGTQLYAIAVHPLASVATRTSNAWVIADYTPLQFCATYFRFWRGTIKYRLKFVRTEFHSGRIAVCFFPNETLGNVGTTFSYADSAYVHRHIIDIRMHNEVEIEVPFISSTPYRPISYSDATSATGTLVIYAVDTLNNPDTVPDTVNIIVEVAAGDDIEFAVPSNNVLQPVYNVTPQMGDDECTFGKFTLGSSKLNKNTIINAEACVGERISSFRSMLKAYDLMTYQATSNPFTSSAFLNVVPFGNPVFHSIVGASAPPIVTPDLVSVLSSIFLFSRGNIRLKMLPRNTSSATPLICYSIYMDSGADNSFVELGGQDGTGFPYGDSNRISVASTMHNTANNSCAEVEVPQYHFLPARINSEHSVHPFYAYSYANTSLATKTVISFTSNNSAIPVNNEFNLYRAASDDFDLGQFISIGPMKEGIYTPH